MNALLSVIFLFWFRAACELWLVSYVLKHAPWSLSNMPFCVHFKYNWKTTGCLQLYYTPNDSSTTKGASFHVKSSEAVITYKLQPHTYIAVSSFSVQVTWQNSGTCDYTTHQMTTSLPRMHLFRSTKRGTTYMYELLSRTSIYKSLCLYEYSVHYM